MMQFTTPKGRYHITEHGNGWAYEITCQKTGDSLYFQDDDAVMIQEESANFTYEPAITYHFDNLICK